VRRLFRQLRDRQRVRQIDPLREVNADALELGEHRFGLDALRDGGDPSALPTLPMASTMLRLTGSSRCD